MSYTMPENTIFAGQIAITMNKPMIQNIIYTLFLSCMVSLQSCQNADDIKDGFLASRTADVTLYSISENDSLAVVRQIVRGAQVEANLSQVRKIDDTKFVPVKIDGEWLYAQKDAFTQTWRDVVREQKMYVRTPATLLADATSSKIAGFAKKGSEIEILDYDTLRQDGRAHLYKVRCNKTEGYIYGKYLVYSSEDAAKRYKAEQYDPVHGAIKNSFGGGEAIGCDFYPTERVKFKDNPMPEACYSLYLNISPAVLGNIDAYIALAKRTKINTFTIDIKDNECPGYKADVMKELSPTNYKYAGDKEKLYKTVVEKLHKQGFYVVGRITCFKDSYFVRDHNEVAISEKSTGQPFKHNKAYWPSAYDRKVWYFNVALAKEAVRKFGFNEINFDYVRFPDRMNSVEKFIDYHNRYGESKVQAIQSFVQYACDELHKEGVYVSIDVFGEAANPGYTTAYGQYWPALSNIADVMCGMPYPDHFSNHYYGIDKPWNHPYEILRAWGERVQGRQKVTPTPAKVRTWVQAYHVMSHVDRNGIDYNAENVAKEIRGLYDAGLTGGYTTWLASSNIEKYTKQEGAFAIDYLKEWKNKNK